MNAQDVLHLIVRDRRQAGHYRIDNEIMAEWYPIIREHGLALYNLLALLAEDGKECARPGLSLLTDYLGWSRSTVHSYRQLLEWCGLIAVDAGDQQRANVYYLLSVPHVSPETLAPLRVTVAEGWPQSHKLRTSVLQRIDTWTPISCHFKARRKVITEKEQPTLPGLPSAHSAPQRAPSALPSTPSAPQRAPSAPPSAHSAPDQQHSDQLPTQQDQDQEATTTTEPGIVYLAADVAAALAEAGILAAQHQRIAQGWHKATGRHLTVGDITAWAEYVRDVNSKRFDERQHLRPGFIVDNLRRGNTAPPTPASRYYSLNCEYCNANPCQCPDDPIDWDHVARQEIDFFQRLYPERPTDQIIALLEQRNPDAPAGLFAALLGQPG